MLKFFSGLFGKAAGVISPWFDEAKIALLWIAVSAVVTTIGGQYMLIQQQAAQIRKDQTQIQQYRDANSGFAAANATLAKGQLDAGAIASLAAKACQSSIKFKVQSQTEAKVISNAQDPSAAVRAYDDVLCRRPEAAGHPKCAAPAAAQGGG